MGMQRQGMYAASPEQEFQEEVIFINRVAKVVKGGRRFSFTALVVVGDRRERVGLGYGRGSEVTIAIQKAVEDAKRNLIRVVKNKQGNTVPYELRHKYCASRVIIKPARPGTGVIAGGPARPIFALAGIQDVTCKYHGSNNPINCARVVFEALKKYRHPKEILAWRRAEPQKLSVMEVIEHKHREIKDQLRELEGIPPEMAEGEDVETQAAIAEAELEETGPESPPAGESPPEESPAESAGEQVENPPQAEEEEE